MRLRSYALALATVTMLFTLGTIVGLSVLTGRAEAQTVEAYRLVETWESTAGSGTLGYLREPAGIATDAAGAAYVVDTARGQVHVFDSGRYVSVWGRLGSDPGELNQPHGIAIDGDRVIVADTGNRRLQVFSRGGQLLDTWRGVGAPWGVAVTADGLVLVTDHEGDRVVILDGDGQRVGSLSGGGTEWGQLDAPTGIGTWPDGRLAVVDGGNQRLQVWADDGSVLQVITNTSTLPFLDVAVLDDDNVVVAALRRLYRIELSTGATRAASSAPVPGGFTGVDVWWDAASPITPTIWTSMRHEALTGLRRYDGPTLGAFEQWLDLPGPAGELVSPGRVTVLGNTAYVLDGWPRIQRFDLDGTPLGQHQVAAASEIAPDGDSAIVSDGATVTRVDLITDTVVAWSWTQVTPTLWIGGLSRNPAGDRLYALDLRAQGVHAITADGTQLGLSPLDTGGSAGYRAYTDMAGRADGRLLLVNRTDGVVALHEANGTLVDQWPVGGVPLRVAADGHGGAFVLTREGWVWKLGPDGSVLSWWDAAADAPDQRGAPSDLDVATDGRVFVLDGRGNRVMVYAPDPASAPPIPPTGDGCTFVRDKWAAPRRVTLGESVGVTLTVSGECLDEGGGADIVLVLDRSGSMAGQKMQAARAAAISFVGEMDFNVSRVGLVVFNTQATAPMSLTTDAAAVVDAIVGFGQPIGGTDIGEGIQLATRELASSTRADTERIIVVMTDGRPEAADIDADDAATAAKAAGMRLFSIGFGSDVDPDLMRRIATDTDAYFFAPSAAELSGIYTEIARRITGGVIVHSGVITDVVPINMTYVPGSAVPPITSYENRMLRWDVQDVRGDLQMRYRLVPQQIGTWPTNVEARMAYRDGLDKNGELVFPIPYVTVVGPPKPIYLPFTGKDYCKPTERHADVALVIDASSSMTGEKFARAKDAALLFVGRLALPADQAAVISFNRDVTLATGLTADSAVLRRAIESVTIVPGTKIDLGLRAATAELLSMRANPDNTRVMVLLTDGQNNAGPDPVRAAAREAASAGIVIYTVALGDDADKTLMREIAGGPGHAFVALTPSELERIYSQIAGLIGCP